MRRLFNFFFLSVLALYLFSGITACKKDYLVADGIEIPDTVSFANDIMPIFNASCNGSGCHLTGGIAPNLEVDQAYLNLALYGMINHEVPEESILYRRMISDNDPMPPEGKVSDSKLQIVLKWIEQGALEN